MYSGLVKIIIVLTGLSPILLSYWIYQMYVNYVHIEIRISFEDWSSFLDDLLLFFTTNFFLVAFIAFLFLTKFIIKHAIRNLTIGEIELKSIKTADNNFNPILFSYLTPWFKPYDFIFIIGVCLLYGVYIVISKNTSHFNLILRLFGYKYYEVQTKKEITYLMLSKRYLINTNQVNKYVSLSNNMIIDVT